MMLMQFMIMLIVDAVYDDVDVDAVDEVDDVDDD